MTSGQASRNTRRRTHTGVTAFTPIEAVSTAKNRRYSLDQTNVASAIYCDGYARIKSRNALTWNTRFLVLNNTELLVYANKQDAGHRRNALERLELVSGRVTPKYELGVDFTITDGRKLLARMFSRTDLTQWVSAFYQIAMLSDVRRVKSASLGDDIAVEKRQVSFFDSVLVRTIPTIPDDQVPELFYSKKDVEKFTEQASSLLRRTETAVSFVLRKPTLPRRRRVV